MEKTPAKTVTLSNSAATRIVEIATKENIPAVLRISVIGGGCSGFQYQYDMEEAAKKEDLVISNKGATLLIDPVSLPYMKDTCVDFVHEPIGSSFKINNPQAVASCGCGTSFSLL